MTARAPVIVLAALALLGCSDRRESFGAPVPCSDPERCAVAAAGGLGTGSGGGDGAAASGAGGGGGESAADLTGTVALVISEDFLSAVPLDATATVQAPAPGAATVTGDYDPSSHTFTVEGALVGSDWLLVEPDPVSGALSTRTLVVVAPSHPVETLVIDGFVLDSIASKLTGSPALDPAAAQVVLQISRGGAPLAGVKLDTDVGATVAYDEGPGTYSSEASATGPAGVILLFDVAGGLPVLELSDADDQSFTITAAPPVGAGQVTFAAFELP